MADLEITKEDVRPIDRSARARLRPPPTQSEERVSDLKEILAELRSIGHRVNSLIAPVRSAIGAAIDESADVKMRDVLKFTAHHFGVAEEDVLSTCRARNFLRPRQVAMYLCRTLTKRSYTEIGMFFRDRDHTTVMHAANQIIKLMNQDSNFSAEIGLLADEILKAGNSALSPAMREGK